MKFCISIFRGFLINLLLFFVCALDLEFNQKKTPPPSLSIDYFVLHKCFIVNNNLATPLYTFKELINFIPFFSTLKHFKSNFNILCTFSINKLKGFCYYSFNCSTFPFSFYNIYLHISHSLTIYVF